MAFHSLYFIPFLFIAVLLFYATKKANVQKWILVGISLLFASFFNPFSALAILMISTVNYHFLKKLALSAARSTKKTIYLTGVLSNVAMLFTYKLLQELITDSGLKFMEGFDNSKWIILGIGFYSLQIIGYYFEVYKRNAKFELSFSQFFLSLAFFSKLPSGPILGLKQAKESYNNQPVSFAESNFSYGVQRILLGLFKKIALADRLLPYVNSVFDEHQYLNGLQIYFGPILFTIQLYLDFSAYIDIAIGSARLFGINLPENFNLPLRATSVVEFWRRWHITLVNWLTSYIFYPISYRFRKWKHRGIALAVICTFLVSALWHGFALTFFIWAACHFTYIILENIFFRKPKEDSGKQPMLKRLLQILVVWHLVAFSNIFFRSPTVSDAAQLYKDFIQMPFLYEANSSFQKWLINGGQDIENEFNYRFAILLCLLFLLFEKKLARYACSEKYRVGYVTLMIVAIAVLGMFNTGERFIYLQF